VLDLGSGAGNDCFVARAIVGETGKVVGIDFTDAMLEKARKNNAKLGFQNVEFVKGDIEDMPLEDNQFDVVISNCVLNLVPDKRKAFAEINRVLKAGRHFCVSDVVVKGNLPEKLKNDAENVRRLCFGSPLEMQEYLDIIREARFQSVTVHKHKGVQLPQEILRKYLNEEEIRQFNQRKSEFSVITVSGEKANIKSMEKKLTVLDRFLTLWIFLAMGVRYIGPLAVSANSRFLENNFLSVLPTFPLLQASF
jgi:ubiquinone/menaquinone biosynthesis C-methylase UbiE